MEWGPRPVIATSQSHIHYYSAMHYSYRKNVSMVRLCKYNEMAFLTSKSINKCVLLAFGVDCTAWG